VAAAQDFGEFGHPLPITGYLGSHHILCWNCIIQKEHSEPNETLQNHRKSVLVTGVGQYMTDCLIPECGTGRRSL
jgi:hypothetical protein